MSKYREAFAKRMATASLKPHHRISLSLSLSLHTLSSIRLSLFFHKYLDLLSLFDSIFFGELVSGLLNFTNRSQLERFSDLSMKAASSFRARKILTQTVCIGSSKDCKRDEN